MKISAARIEVPDSCPPDCPKKYQAFYQGNFCSRCPVFNCRKDENGFCLVEPEDYREDWALEFKAWFDSKYDPNHYPALLLSER